MRNSDSYCVNLGKFARDFYARARNQVWRDDSLDKAERTLFIGFLYVRKLVECRKVNHKCVSSSMAIMRSQISRGRDVSDFMRDDLFDDLESISWTEVKVDIVQVANAVIHAWWLVPCQNDNSGLGGYILTTDKKRNREFLFLPTDSIVTVFDQFSNGSVRSLRAKRDENGRLKYWRAE